MKKTLVILLALFYTVSLFPQSSFGLKAGGGLSRISNSGLSSANLTIQFAPYFQGGLFYNLAPGKKRILFGAELLYSHVTGKEMFTVPTYKIDANGNFAGYGELSIYRTTSLSYIALPLYCGIKFKKLTLNVGVQTSIVLATAEKEHGTFDTGHGEQPYSSQSTDLTYLRHYDLGPKAGIMYSLSRKFALEAGYYYGAYNIQRQYAGSQPPIIRRHIQQITFGIRYALWASK